MNDQTFAKSSILIICGSTGSGKTKLAFQLAGDKPTSIISADSRQVYRDLDIITGKDIPKDFVKKGNFYEKDNLRLWGFDLLTPNQVFDAAEFSKMTQETIAKETSLNRRVIIVGGTGFYLKSLTKPETLAKVAPNEVLRRSLTNLRVENLQQRLWEINPQKFVSMNQSDASNPRRLIRAIEVAITPDKSESKELKTKPFEFRWIGLKISLEELKPRIERRVRDRLDQGAIFEVENLLKKYPNQNLPIYTTLGIRPIIRFLAHEIDLATLVEVWVTDEMNYAKRQLTWFKKQPQIFWYDLGEASKLTLK